MSYRVLAAVWVDLETNGLGLPSRLLDPFPSEGKGEILLLRVLRRALECTAFEKLVILALPGDARRLKGLALPERCEVMPVDVPDVPQRAWLRKARKWAVDGWRGGIGWTTAFDEEGPPAALWEACRRHRADAVLHLPSHAPFLDPALNAALVDLHLRRRGNFQFSFAQAPAGVVGQAYHPEFLETMARGGLTPRNALMVRPGQEGMDPQRTDCHLDVGERLRNSPYRLSCESPRLWRFCEALAAGGVADAAAAVEFVDARPALWRGVLPREILADLPVGTEPAAWQGWLAALAPAGDSTLTLGVREDPLAHPRWREFLTGAYGVHLRTPRRDLDEATAVALMSSPLDVLTLATPTGDAVARLSAIQRRIGHGAPLISLEFVLTRDSEGELPEWWARWHGKADWLSIVPGDPPALDLSPPRRRPCAKLSRLLYVASDGTVHPCAEEPPGAGGLGHISRDPVAAVWAGGALEALGSAHAAGRWPQADPPCASCRRWAWV